MEHEITILSGKVASDHIHVLVAYRPQVDVSMIVQWLKGISSRILLQEFAHLRNLPFYFTLTTARRPSRIQPLNGVRVRLSGPTAYAA